MRLPPALAKVRPEVLAGVLVAVVFALSAAIVLAVTGGGNSNNGGSDAAGSNPTAVARSILADVAPSDTPQPEEPTATPAPNRADCNAIFGTPYLSEEERAWFHDNCTGAGAGGPVTAISGPQPSPGGGQAPLGDTLIIPSIGVNAPVWSATVGPDGSMPNPTGYFNVVEYNFPSHPGLGGNVNSGNIVLAGHVDSAVYGLAVFYYIRNLGAGDTIQYRTADGRTIDYVVTSVGDYSPSADWDSLVSSRAADMTLITCTGTWNAAAHEYSLRRVVHARKA